MTTTLRQKKVHLHGWNVEVNKTEASSTDHMLHMPEEEWQQGIFSRADCEHFVHEQKLSIFFEQKVTVTNLT